jgi:hypothetical protein
MTTLADRRAQAAALARTTRLLYGSAAVGLVSLVGICAVVLRAFRLVLSNILDVDAVPTAWRMASTQGQWVAFALLAASSFGWLCTPITVIGSLQDGRTTRLSWFGLLVRHLLPARRYGLLTSLRQALSIIHAGMAAYFEAAAFQLRDGYVQRVW